VLLEAAVVGDGQPEEELSAAPFFKLEMSPTTRSDFMGRTMLHVLFFFLTVDSSLLVSSRSRRGNRKDLSVFQERASRETLATGTTPSGPMGVGSSGVDSPISGLMWGKSNRSTSLVVGSGLEGKKLMGPKSLFITICFLEETLSDYSVVS
jgi:hypothetical protein